MDCAMTDALPAGHRQIGRYVLHGEIASGGMATVYFGRQIGHIGFSRTVAVKRMHAQYAKQSDFISMFLDEVRIVARIRHPNVVPVLDLVAQQGELLMVVEYVHGETLSRLLREARLRAEDVPTEVIGTIIVGALDGLHAAHEAVSEQGEPLAIVHRDVSPQNIMVGADGIARVLDFGVAKATDRLQTTREGQLKGKIAYMAPEQIRGSAVDRRTDVYAVGVVLWEALAGRRLFEADSEAVLMTKVLDEPVQPPGFFAASISRSLDDVVMKAVQRDPTLRFQTAQQMAVELEKAVGLATPRQVGRWVETFAQVALKVRANRVTEIESSSGPLTDPFKKLGGEGAAELLARASQDATDPPSPSTARKRVFVTTRPLGSGEGNRDPADPSTRETVQLGSRSKSPTVNEPQRAVHAAPAPSDRARERPRLHLGQGWLAPGGTREAIAQPARRPPPAPVGAPAHEQREPTDRVVQPPRVASVKESDVVQLSPSLLLRIGAVLGLVVVVAVSVTSAVSLTLFRKPADASAKGSSTLPVAVAPSSTTSQPSPPAATAPETAASLASTAPSVASAPMPPQAGPSSPSEPPAVATPPATSTRPTGAARTKANVRTRDDDPFARQ
jgi:eukaryotic-like serine/threonine-protein kinase